MFFKKLRSFSISWFLFLILLVSPFLAANEAVSQQVRPGGQAQATPKKVLPTKRLQLNPNSVVVHKRPAMAFRAHSISEFRDPKTGAPLTLDSRIAIMKTDAQGRRVPKIDANGNPVVISGKEYLDQINDLEKKFNAFGYSLRDKQTGPVKLQEHRMNVQKFQMQNTDLRGTAVAKRAKVNRTVPALIPKLNLPSMKKNYEDRVRILSAGTPQSNTGQTSQTPLGTPTANQIAQKQVAQIQQAMATQAQASLANLPGNYRQPYSDSWSKSMGDSDYFGALINADMTVDMANLYPNFKSNAGASVTIFGNNANLLSVIADAKAPPQASNTPMTLNFELKVLGDDLLAPVHKSGGVSISAEDNTSQGYTVDYDIPFTLGPVPIVLTFGFTATVGVQSGIYVTPLLVNAKVTPYVHTSAFASCAIDYYVASGGVRATLTLLNDDLDFGATVGLLPDKPNTVEIVGYGNQRLNALSGNLIVFVEVDYLVGSKEWDWTVFEWSGFKYEDILFMIGPGDINLGTGTATSVQANLNEDCMPFNPASATVQNIQNRWKIVDGTHWLFDFGANKAAADRALSIIKFYKMNKTCFVGRPQPSFSYLLVDANAPSGMVGGEDCTRFNPTTTKVAQVSGRWKIVNGNTWMYDFGDMKGEAERTLGIINKYGFNSQCYVARPNPPFQYLHK